MPKINIKTSVSQVMVEVIEKIEHPINDHEVAYDDQECPNGFCIDGKLIKQERKECEDKIDDQIRNILIHINN